MRGALAGALLAVLVGCLVSESSAFRPRGVPEGSKGGSHIPKKGGKLPMETMRDSLKPVAIKRDSLDPVMVISKLMGIGIMSGSFFLKMPQIIKILSTSSVEGLSPMAVYHELPLYSSGVIYHYLQEFPISTFGEMVVVMVQNIMIVILLWIYQQPAVEKTEILSKCLQFVAICAVQLSLPKPVQPILAYANVPLLLSSCVPQVLLRPLPDTGAYERCRFACLQPSPEACLTSCPFLPCATSRSWPTPSRAIQARWPSPPAL